MLAARALGRSLDPLAAGAAACLLCFVAIPAISRGRTPAQGLLRLRTVRPDASPARWYQYLARYGLLLLFATLPAAALALVLSAGSHGGEAGALARFVGANRAFFTGAWAVLMTAWAASLVVRAVRSSRTRTPFVMLNGLMSNTRVMTEEGARMERERRRALDVEDVVRLERMIAEDGTPLADLMERAGRAVAQKVVDWVPDPAPVTVLAGAGNNGGDGWVAARALAERGYPVTLVTPDIAERLRAEPARATALDVFADAAARRLPLRVLVAHDADVLADVLDEASAVVDALLGTGFSGNEVREPYAGWIRAANRRRFEGSRGKGRGRHRKREREKARHARAAKGAPAKAKDAPFALAVDTPSGLSAQTGRVASPCFAADMTLTMLAYKPGLVQPRASRWTGAVMLARLADIEPYLRGKGIGGR